MGVVKEDGLMIAFSELCIPAGETIPTAKVALAVIAAMMNILS